MIHYHTKRTPYIFLLFSLHLKQPKLITGPNDPYIFFISFCFSRDQGTKTKPKRTLKNFLWSHYQKQPRHSDNKPTSHQKLSYFSFLFPSPGRRGKNTRTMSLSLLTPCASSYNNLHSPPIACKHLVLSGIFNHKPYTFPCS